MKGPMGVEMWMNNCPDMSLVSRGFIPEKATVEGNTGSRSRIGSVREMTRRIGWKGFLRKRANERKQTKLSDDSWDGDLWVSDKKSFDMVGVDYNRGGSYSNTGGDMLSMYFKTQKSGQK